MSAYLKFVQTIRDPVHGSIPVTDLEIELLKTRCVGKLRWIKQMGLAFFSFPGANHTRFEHSIGAMHVASLVFLRLSRSKDLDERDRNQIANHLQDFRLAALFHDLGHAPFSHTMEEFFQRHPEYSSKDSKSIHSHEHYTKQIISTNPELGNAVKKFEGVIPEAIKLDYIASLSVGQDPKFGSLFSDSLDVDRLDYIMRDSYYCGLPFGSIDLNALISGLILENVDGEYRLYFSREAVSSIEGFLTSKFQLARTVFNHAKNRSMSLYFFDALREAYEKVLSTVRDRVKTLKAISDLIHNDWTDYDVFYFIRNPIETLRMHAKSLCDSLGLGLETDVKMEQPDVFAKIIGGISPESGYSFESKMISPKTRYDLHVLSMNPYFQRRLSEKLHEKMSYITFVNVEAYNMAIKMDGEKRNISEVSPLVSSLVNACLHETNLNFYTSERPSREIPENEIRQTAKDLREACPPDKQIGTDLILLLNYHVYDWFSKQKSFFDRPLYFEGDVRFQAFFAEVTRGMDIPYPTLIDMQKAYLDLGSIGEINTNCFRFYSLKMKTDMDILADLSLTYYRRSTIEISGDNGKKFYPRSERRISRIGREYVTENLLGVIPRDVQEKIVQRTNDILNKEKDRIVECIRIEEKGTEVERRENSKKKKDYIVCFGS